MSRIYLIGEDHVPYRVHDLIQWSLAFDSALHHVARAEIVGGFVVSTIFTGIDSSPCGEPLLFETMVLRDGKALEQYRYATWAEAEIEHNLLVASIESAGGLLDRIYRP
jgi:hypothetical protein